MGCPLRGLVEHRGTINVGSMTPENVQRHDTFIETDRSWALCTISGMEPAINQVCYLTLDIYTRYIEHDVTNHTCIIMNQECRVRRRSGPAQPRYVHESIQHHEQVSRECFGSISGP